MWQTSPSPAAFIEGEIYYSKVRSGRCSGS